jgi:hypothetical protein
MAIANQQRAILGQAPFNGTQALTRLYQLGATQYLHAGPLYFNDITFGNNGYPNTVGYDLVTGLGTPNMPVLITALGGASSSTTTVAGSFVVAVTPAGTTTTPAGVAVKYTVTLEDALGNVLTNYTGTVHFTSTDSKATLPATYTFTAADAGIHTFSVTYGTVGNQTFTVKDTTNNYTGTSAAITVTPGAATHFSVTGTQVGNYFDLTVTALDAYGNVATGFLGTATFSSSSPYVSLPSAYTFTAADKGVHTFVLARPRAYGTFKASVSSPGLTTDVFNIYNLYGHRVTAGA